MQQGLVLFAALADAAGPLTSRQQCSANTQVVEIAEQLTDANRQVPDTAQRVAAASNLTDLAGNLENTATTAKDQY